MFVKQSLIVVLACLAATVTANSNFLHRHEPNINLLNFMSRSADIMQRNPTRSLDCFNHYMPLINQYGLDYQKKYDDCKAASDKGRSIVEESTVDARNILAQKSEDSCRRLNNCPKSASVEDEYQCYIDGGSENARVSYSISVDASDGYANFLEDIRLIVNKENRCTNECKREYENNCDAAYSEFNDCVLGYIDVPTEAPSTEAPSTEAPSSEAPTTEASSTEAPSTEAPSTEAPSTEAPSTEAPSTEAPSTEAPSTEAPSTEAPTPEPPTLETSTEESSTAEPSTEKTSTVEPSSVVPTTEEPTSDDTDDSKIENLLPEEDLFFRNLKYRILKQLKV